MRGAAGRRYGGGAVGLAVLLFTALPAYRLIAQSDPRLQDAITLAQAGRQDSARAVVQRLLAALSPRDSVYPEALYTAGILAADAPSVATNLQRVIVEYGWSPWADDALLRLTQLHYAQGDPAATIQAAARLQLDYPDSPLRARADFWGARAYFDLRNEAQGCALIGRALEDAGEDVELRNQVSFYAARCPEQAAAESSPPATPGDTAPAVSPPSRPASFAVQVLAVKSAAQVDEMLTRLKVMGYAGRVVRDTSGLLKVRVGSYTTREEAQVAQRRLRARLGGQPFVVEEP